MTTELLLEDFEGDLTYFNAHPCGPGHYGALGQHYPGSHGSLNSSTDFVHRGKQGAVLHYQFYPGVDEIPFSWRRPPKITVPIKGIGLWVYGDASGHELCVSLGNAWCGRSVISWRGWKKVVLPVESWVQFPSGATLADIGFSFALFRGSDKKLTGKIAFDDLFLITTEEGAKNLPARISVSSDKLGHLWGPGETACINVRLTNRCQTKSNFRIELCVTDESDKPVQNKRNVELSIGAWQSRSIPVNFKAEKFGIFKLKYSVFSAGKSVCEGTQLFGFAPSPSSSSGEGKIGVVAHFLRFAEEREITMMQRAGVRWVRTETDWFAFVRRPGAKPDWNYYRTMYRKVHSAGIRCLGNPAYPPSFINGAKEYGCFVEDVVKHLKKYVSHWEILNEPNLKMFFHGPAHYAVKYIKEGFDAVHRADPQATAMTPGLSGVPCEYLDELLKNGMLTCTDKISFHPYWDSWKQWNQWRQILQQYNAAEVGQWVTEDIEPGTAGGITRRAARWLGRGIEKWFAYDLRDDDYYSTPDNIADWGLLQGDFTVKAMFIEFVNLVRMLDDAQPLPARAAPEGIEWVELLRPDGKRIAVVWTERDETQPLTISASLPSFTVVDIYGNTSTLHATDGRITLEISKRPIYVWDCPVDLRISQNMHRG